MNPAVIAAPIAIIAIIALASTVEPRTHESTANELFAITNASNDAFRLAGLEKPWPTVHTVAPGHSRHKRDTIAYAAIVDTPEGRERRLYIMRDQYRLGMEHITGTIYHEASHFSIAERYGVHHLASHGPKFSTLCRSITDPVNCTEELHQ